LESRTWSNSSKCTKTIHRCSTGATAKISRTAAHAGWVTLVDTIKSGTSQSVKTTESGGPRGYDAGKKIKGRKRHIMTDTQGLARLNRCRRLAKDWEASIASSQAWLLVASIRQLSRRIAKAANQSMQF
jgi:DDE family transposase